MDGFTTLEFSRNYITCDDKDLPIEVIIISMIEDKFLTGLIYIYISCA